MMPARQTMQYKSNRGEMIQKLTKLIIVGFIFMHGKMRKKMNYSGHQCWDHQKINFQNYFQTK